MLTEKDFIATSYNSLEAANFEWSAPSNIALVKYWGKKEQESSIAGEKSEQIPANPSISFTLNHCKTITKLGVMKKLDSKDFSFELLF
jgi:diphosphomevalonate decarboxylase